MKENVETLDLGAVTVDLRNILRLGDPAPLFDVATIAGESVRLKDLRGKVVLLDFWASWCGPCIAELPSLKKLHDELGKDGKFEIVGLNLDEKIESAQRIVESKKMPWIQGYVGDWSKAALPVQYSVSSIPAKYLIGKDGKIVAINPRGPELRKEIEKALR